MCSVEIEKSPKLMPSCAIKIADNMKIHTRTNLVKKTRESILEFLLINHPLDCPICDQGGECDSQDQAMIYGSDRGRFYEYKRSIEDRNGGALIKTIMTRCIHCTRCIRFATEIAGVEVYGTSGRGKGMEVGTYISDLFGSELSGNVIDLCPVGALTSKPYAFTVRPWELKSIESIDVLDAIGSNIRIDTKGSELMRILPRPNDLVNQQWITDKTRFPYDGLKCQRLHYPMIRMQKGQAPSLGGLSAPKQSSWIPVSWKQAFDIIRENLAGANVQFSGIIGQFVDQESIHYFKKFLNKSGSSNPYIENPQNPLNRNANSFSIDFRSNYLPNSRLAFSGSTLKEGMNLVAPKDFISPVSSNPRDEASLFNVRLRQ